MLAKIYELLGISNVIKELQVNNGTRWEVSGLPYVGFLFFTAKYIQYSLKVG